MTKRAVLYTLLPLFVLASCNVTKNVPKGDYLYTGGKVKIEDKDLKKKQKKELQADLNTLLRPKPNTSILGLKPKLWIYNITKNAKKGPLKWIKKLGEPPVLFSKVKVDYNRDLVTNRLENRGFFQAYTTADTVIKKRKASMIYHAAAGPRYLIDSVNFVADSSALGKAIHNTAAHSLLKRGKNYDLEVIKSERERIDNRLKEEGFYYFSPENLIVEVDSTGKRHKVNLYVTIKKNTSEKAQTVYNINNVVIYPNFQPTDTLKGAMSTASRYNDFYVIDPQRTFRPQVFGRTMFFHKGDIYNRTDHNMSLSRLSSLGTFKFVKNRFFEVDSINNQLDAYYYLTPYAKKSIKAIVTGKTNSANFTGADFTLNWRNRNTFRGAELLTVSAYVGADVQFSGNNSSKHIQRYGAEANLSIPRLLTPFKARSTSAFIPRTKVTLGFDLLQRPDSYTINSFRTSFGYSWKESLEKEHQLTVFGFTLVKPKADSMYLREAANRPSLLRVIEDQLTFGPTYNFNFTNTHKEYRTNTFYFNGNVDLSANLTGLISGAKEERSNKIWGVPYAQYIRTEADMRYYRRLGFSSKWANRVILGYGYAYGNSRSLPFVKQFFIGGTNSLRAFKARSLGPGTYRDPHLGTDAITADQSGDIKLELNSEYRAKLFSIVNGALFVDAGNIWLLNEDTREHRPGTKFSKNFLKELAVGAGAGVRVDASILIVRLDVGIPLRKPWMPEGERWVVDKINFGDKVWRKDNIVYNLAIGYPF